MPPDTGADVRFDGSPPIVGPGARHPPSAPVPPLGYADRAGLSEGRRNVPRVTDPGDVPPEILDRLRPACLGLPEAYEEPAWVGTRWRIRKRTFAHVLTVGPDHQAASARTAASDEPICVLNFRSPGDEIAGLLAGGHPFFKPDWGADVVGMFLEGGIDWDEITELLTDSYCIMAPKKLAKLVEEKGMP